MSKLMKELLFVSLILATFFAVAMANAEEERDRPKERRDFTEVKVEILKNIDARISSLKQHKECVSATKGRDGLKSCMESHREEMRKLRPKRARGGMTGGMKRDE